MPSCTFFTYKHSKMIRIISIIRNKIIFFKNFSFSMYFEFNLLICTAIGHADIRRFIGNIVNIINDLTIDAISLGTSTLPIEYIMLDIIKFSMAKIIAVDNLSFHSVPFSILNKIKIDIKFKNIIKNNIRFIIIVFSLSSLRSESALQDFFQKSRSCHAEE